MQAEELTKQRQDSLSNLRKDDASSDFSGVERKVNTGNALNLDDEKAIRMFEIHANQSFKKAQNIQRMRLKLLWWVIRNRVEQNLKRAFDVVVSCLTLPFIAPIMIVTAIAIKLDTPGPVFFKQERVGKWSKPFYCYKFRSIYTDAEEYNKDLPGTKKADQIVFKMKNDPQLTRVGKVIRNLSIDELPQIFNVIKGDMSIVGPRPPVPYEVEYYRYDMRRRLDIVPGITGLQQVSGRSDVEFKRWIDLDLQYIEEQSLLKDIEIMLKTIFTII